MIGIDYKMVDTNTEMATDELVPSSDVSYMGWFSLIYFNEYYVKYTYSLFYLDKLWKSEPTLHFLFLSYFYLFM